MLNNTQVKELFEREAVLLGSSDGVPCYRAAELFGENAHYAERPGNIPAVVYQSCFLKKMKTTVFRDSGFFLPILKHKGGRAGGK